MNVTAGDPAALTQNGSVTSAAVIQYPDSDGKPMADNTKQARWIVTLYCNLCFLFRDRLDVCVFADLLWYYEKENSKQNIAPDVMVVFGRPKGDRGSYRQWEEDNVPLTVVFEILSPSNTPWEMSEKQSTYDELGVEEYYLYDPETNRLMGFHRIGEVFRRIRPIDGHVSRRLGIRFDLSGPELVVRAPDGTPFMPFEELGELRLKEKARADAEKSRADAEKSRADAVDSELQQVKHRYERLIQLTRKMRDGTADAAEQEELLRLENA